MRQTINALTSELQALLDYLTESGVALYVTSIRTTPTRVSWSALGTESDLLTDVRQHPRVSDYRRWVHNGLYSAMLTDGSLLQITYDFDHGSISKHRLAFVPTPYDMDIELLRVEAAGDVVDIYLEDPTVDAAMVSAVRFDYDPKSASEDHPHSHLTFNSPDCRIACSAPLRLGHFVEFVFRNFYPKVWGEHEYLRALSRKNWHGQTVTDSQTHNLHVAWRSQLETA